MNRRTVETVILTDLRGGTLRVRHHRDAEFLSLSEVNPGEFAIVVRYPADGGPECEYDIDVVSIGGSKLSSWSRVDSGTQLLLAEVEDVPWTVAINPVRNFNSGMRPEFEVLVGKCLRNVTSARVLGVDGEAMLEFGPVYLDVYGHDHNASLRGRVRARADVDPLTAILQITGRHGSAEFGFELGSPLPHGEEMRIVVPLHQFVADFATVHEYASAAEAMLLNA